VPKGRLFPTNRDDLIDCIALVDAIQRGELDRTFIPRQPLDVLAQQIVAMVACEEWQEEELYRLVRAAYPYRDLERRTFTEVVRMLAEGYSTRRGLRGAYLHWDRIHGRLRARRGASLTAITCGGAIPDTAEYRVIVEPSGEVVGSVDEDFAIESLSGDIFQLGNSSWRILRLDSGALRVEDAHHAPPSIPFWFGEAPGRSQELSEAVSRFRREVGRRVERQDPAQVAAAWAERLGIAALATEQAVSYLAAAETALGVLPTHDTVVFERFFDESGGMHFIIHAPFGSRVNRAWGLALRKRFCRTFNFELQAAATENALLLSLGVAQSFALEEVKEFLSPTTVREVLIQALLDAPMFKVRWRWNAVCSLALRRFQGGHKTPPYLLRMQAEDLVTCVFPEQLACLENIVGDRHIPDHPLVQQTIEDCLMEAMDLERLVVILQGIREGRIGVVCRDVTEPSPLAAEIVNARVYSFLDGAPLEERRTRAVAMRRWLDPATAGDLGRLDQATIARVVDEMRPRFETVEELHDALYSGGYLTGMEVTVGGGAEFARHLAETRRAARLPWGLCDGIWIAAERWPQFRVLGGKKPGVGLSLPAELNSQEWGAEEALTQILAARLECSGPMTIAELERQLGLDGKSLETALLRLEREGFVLRGHFRDEVGALEWCQRHLLARIHRHTIHRLRAEIEPVTTRDFLRYLLRWQHVHPDTRVRGKEGLNLVLEQLEGFQAPAASWERDILPARVADYDPAWLDALCLGGRFLWRRIPRDGAGGGAVRSAPIALLSRARVPLWTRSHPEARLSSVAARVVEQLERRGALFFDELMTMTGLLRAQVEDALAELVGKGLVNCDSFQGLRSMLLPETRKRRFRKSYGIEEAGRWNALSHGDRGAAAHSERANVGEQVVRVLLRRYGILFRALLERENLAPSWLELVTGLRRLEARGEVRGGRFVAAQYGEQFALPEAVEMLRGVRNGAREEEEPVALSSADPLNLLGIVTPGEKVPTHSGRHIVFRDGIPEAYGKSPRKIVARTLARRGPVLWGISRNPRGER
jgi:ATP-dependent Lhr-like helicase